MMRIVPVVLALALVGVVTAAVVALLPACGVRLPLGLAAPSSCVSPGAAQAALRDQALEADTAALTRRIAQLERELARARCTRAPDPVAPDASVPALPDTPSGIDPDAFEARDLGAMEGCWALDSDYRTQDPQTGAFTDFTEWNICLDAAGRGSQTMRATDGTTCSGDVTGAFGDDGTFTVIEPGDLECSNNSRIFRRETTCSLAPDGRALCDSVQPGRNTRAPATLRRAEGGP